MRIHIHRIRLGFATNSSSTHSIVILKEGHDVRDNEVEEQEFGWNHWTAASQEAKLAWLGQAIRDTLARAIGHQTEREVADPAGDIVSELLGVVLDPNGRVDHQSRVDLPPLHGALPREDLLAQVTTFLSDPRVVVVGGNDNTEETHHLSGDPLPGGRLGPLNPFVETGGSGKLRWDKRDGYWSLFSQENGTVLRWRISVDPGPDIIRSEFPSLVDVNITNACDIGCAYCYRGSTPGQPHADVYKLTSILRDLSYGGTFEVALGGGEPLDHPEIDQFLENVKGIGVTVNVTTRRLVWLKNTKLAMSRLSAIRAFGVSVDSAAGAKKAIAAFKEAGVDSRRVSIQVVVGVTTREELWKIRGVCEREYTRLVLLGHKTTGRGPAVTPPDVTDWAEILKGSYCRIGIDTVLAKVWRDWLKEHAWGGSYETEEGRFSCFIDAVPPVPVLYRSSYDPEDKGIPLYYGGACRPGACTIGEAFLKMQERFGIVAPEGKSE